MSCISIDVWNVRTAPADSWNLIYSSWITSDVIQCTYRTSVRDFKYVADNSKIPLIRMRDLNCICQLASMQIQFDTTTIADASSELCAIAVDSIQFHYLQWEIASIRHTVLHILMIATKVNTRNWNGTQPTTRKCDSFHRHRHCHCRTDRLDRYREVDRRFHR